MYFKTLVSWLISCALGPVCLPVAGGKTVDGQDLPDLLDGQLDLLDLLDGLGLPEDDDIKNSHCVSNTALVIQTQHGTAVYLKRKNTGYFGCVILT